MKKPHLRWDGDCWVCSYDSHHARGLTPLSAWRRLEAYYKIQLRLTIEREFERRTRPFGLNLEKKK